MPSGEEQRRAQNVHARVGLLLAEASVAYALLELFLRFSNQDPERWALIGPAFYTLSFSAWSLSEKNLSRTFRPWLTLPLVVVSVFVAGKVVAAGSFGQLAGLGWLGTEIALTGKGFPLGIATCAMTSTIWWRVSILSGNFVTPKTAARTTQFGTAILFMVFGIAAIKDLPISHAAAVIAVFFSSALFGLDRSHSQDMRQGRAERWPFLLAIVAVALVVGAGIALGSLLNEEVIRLLISPVVWAGQVVASLIDFLSDLVPAPGSAGDSLAAASAVAVNGQSNDQLVLALPEEIRDTGRLIWAIVFLGLLSAAAVRVLGDVAMGVLRNQQLRGVTKNAVPFGLRNDIRLLVRWLGRSWEQLRWCLHRLGQRSIVAQSRNEAAIRELYRGLLYWTAKRQIARREDETAYEFGRRLGAAFPEAAEDIATLTHSYVYARYRTETPAEEVRGEAVQAWRRIRPKLS